MSSSYDYFFLENSDKVGVAKWIFATPQIKLMWRPQHLATADIRAWGGGHFAPPPSANG